MALCPDPRRWAWTAAGGFWLACVASLSGQSSQVYGIFQGQEFMQAGPLLVPMIPAYWECWARGFSAGALAGAGVTTPLGEAVPVTPDSEGAYTLQAFLSTAAQTVRFPVGSYSLRVTNADNSAFTVGLTQSAPAYPTTPQFPPSLWGPPLPAGVDFQLSWKLGSDAQAGDWLVLRVQDTGGGGFETPWPGQPGALSGLATTYTVPGNLLHPNTDLLLTLTRYRIAFEQPLSSGRMALAGSASAVTATLIVSQSTEAAEVAQYRLLAGQVFTQDGDSPPSTPAPSGFAFEPSVWAATNNGIYKVTLALPGGAALALPESGNEILWQTNESFASEAGLWAAAPPGAYVWTFSDQAKTATNTLGAGPWPPPLAIANWTALQTNSFTNDVIIRWSPPVVASTNDQVELAVLDVLQKVVFRNPDYSSGGVALPGTTNQVTIPAGTLTDGQDYQARLRYILVLQQDTQTVAGATGLAGRYAETQFPLGTRVAQPLEILTTSLPAAVVGTGYSAQLIGDGGRWPCSWSIAQGNLPPGLGFDSSGIIEGTPYANGTFAFVVQFADSLGNTLDEPLSISVTGSLTPLAITTTDVATVGDGLFCILPPNSVGGVEPYSWSIASGRLPSGLEFDQASGLISGIAQEAGSFSVDLKVQDAAGQVQTQTLTVNVPSATNNPVLRITGFSVLPAQGLQMGLNAQAGEWVTVLASPDLAHWQALFSTNMPANGLVEWTDPQAGLSFYRACRGTPEPQYAPATVNVSVDASSTVQALLTAAPLSLSLTNAAGVVFQLEVPTNAVPQDANIQMSLVQSLDGSPIPVNLLGGVSFAPEGLYMLTAATLTVTFPTNLLANTAGFAFNEGGADFHLYPCFVTNNTTTFPINHFSSYGVTVVDPRDVLNMINFDRSCNSQSAAEASIGLSILQGNPEREAIWAALSQWYQGSLSPHLIAAQQNDELLWSVANEFTAWDNFLEKYVLVNGGDAIENGAMTLWSAGWPRLARAFANGVNRAHVNCVSQSRPFQAVRMMKLAQAARGMSLEAWLVNDPDFFSDARMQDRFQRAFRFELQVHSDLDLIGKWRAGVNSDKCPFVANSYDDSNPEIRLTGNGGVSLSYQGWSLTASAQRTRPVVTAGSLIGVRLSIWPNYPTDTPPGPCSKGTTWDDPTAPTIESVLDAVDPVQQFLTRNRDGSWTPSPIANKAASENWWGLFRMTYYVDLVTENDASGQAHIDCAHVKDAWQYDAKQLFAEASLQNTFSFTEQYEPNLRIYHAPRPLKASDTLVP